MTDILLGNCNFDLHILYTKAEGTYSFFGTNFIFLFLIKYLFHELIFLQVTKVGLIGIIPNTHDAV